MLRDRVGSVGGGALSFPNWPKGFLSLPRHKGKPQIIRVIHKKERKTGETHAVKYLESSAI